MISSRVLENLQPLFEIIKKAKGKTIRQIKEELFIKDKCKMKKGASGLIVENLLGVENNNRDEADLPETWEEKFSMLNFADIKYVKFDWGAYCHDVRYRENIAHIEEILESKEEETWKR